MNPDLCPALERLSAVLHDTLAASGDVPTCAKGCAACCEEPMYATRAEAAACVDAVRAAGGEAAVGRLRFWVAEWLALLRRTPLWHERRPDAIAYRRLRLKCPLLTAQDTCGVYAARPAGCRMHVTKGPREGCEDLAKRRDQTYIDVVGSALRIPPLLAAIREASDASVDADGTVAVDHLGVMLGEVLGLDAPASGARATFRPPVEAAS